MAETDTIASLCDAAAKAMREAGAGAEIPPALIQMAAVLDFLACDADRACRYGHADQLSALASCIMAAAVEIAKPASSKGTP